MNTVDSEGRVKVLQSNLEWARMEEAATYESLPLANAIVPSAVFPFLPGPTQTKQSSIPF